MTALRKDLCCPHSPMPLRSRSVRNGPRTSLRAKRCWMPALAKIAISHLPAPARRTRARRRPRLFGRAPGRIGGTVRLWHVSAGGGPRWCSARWRSTPSCRDLGIGAALMSHALAAAKARGHGAVILLGDAPYYARFGFSVSRPASCRCPARSNATGCSASNCARPRSTAPGHDRAVGRSGAERQAAARRKSPQTGRSRRLI